MQKQSLPEFDNRLRFPIEVSAQFLGISRARLWQKIKAEEIAVIRDGRRVFVPGSEIERLSRAPQ